MNNFMIAISMIGFAISFIMKDVVRLIFFGVMYLNYKIERLEEDE